LKLRLFASLYFGSGRQVSIWLFVVNINFLFALPNFSHRLDRILIGFRFQENFRYFNIVHHRADTHPNASPTESFWRGFGRAGSIKPAFMQVPKLRQSPALAVMPGQQW
jgi:hypothetical protein